MLLTEKSIDFISDHLEVENNPITFKLISRELDFSVSQSKNILLEYYNKFKSNKKFILHYCITGTSNNGNILIKITNMTDLNKSKEEFKTIKSCDIFSIELNSNLSLSNIVSINETTKKPYNKLNMTKWGLIQTHTSITLANETEIKEAKPIIRVKTEPVKTELVKPEIKAKKESKTKNEHELANRPAYVSRKASTIPSSKAEMNLEKKSEQPITSLYKSRKNPPKRKSEVIIDDIRDDFDDDDDDDDDLTSSTTKKTKVETEQQRKKREENQKMLDTMFDDDFSDDDVKEEKETGKLLNNDIDIDVDIGEKSNSDEKINDINDEDVKMVDISDENSNDADEGPKPIDNFVRKKTKNEKATDLEQAKEEPEVETFVDDDGYVVRKVNKKVAPNKSKSVVSSQPSTKNFTIDTKKDNKLNKKQASLMSFFKKK